MTDKPIAIVLTLACGLCLGARRSEADDLDRGFADPPPSARLRAYWWWLNGNVTKEAITRDLEWMKQVGMGGALINDAGGADQGGHAPVPAGPLYGSPAWRRLLAHTLNEADRLGLELSLNPQSGWNLGGPDVPLDEAAKQLVWSQAEAHGPSKFDRALPEPSPRRGFYRDVAVLACRIDVPDTPEAGPTPTIGASSADPRYPAARADDGTPETFWCSAGSLPGEGPDERRPAWLQFAFPEEITLAGLSILGRPGYGPRGCVVQVSDDGVHFRTVQAVAIEDGRTASRSFEASRGTQVRLVFRDSYDRGSPDRPRNVQVAEVALRGTGGHSFMPAPRVAAPIRQLDLKSGTREMGGSAPDGSALLKDDPAWPGEPVVKAAEVRDLTGRLEDGGRLRWDVPEGRWRILRFGYTNNGSHVSTSSAGWQGRVVDYLDPDALKAYWQRNVAPMLAEVGAARHPSLKFLQTDSWELGGVNWTPRFADEFRRRRGYDPDPYLPVLAGLLVEDREVSNRFLNDLRKTIGDCVADNHYGVLATLAHAQGLGIHPESGGPHGGPFEALKCLGRSDFPMSEFWVPSPHRPGERDRFFVKQAACAAHIYGRRLVAAEGFTSIGPQWNDLLWRSQKPSFDHEACAGLNLVFWHTFTCSPAAMGLPGQEYFAGTHFNPNITWARQAPALVGYLNRCQFLLQQGEFVADALFYHGDHVPNFVRLKSDDPARVLPGRDYDVCNEEVLTTRLTVRDGRVAIPNGPSYRVLVLPELEAMSLEAMRAIHRLVEQGATVVGPKPSRVTGLRDYPRCDLELRRLADALWGDRDGRTRTLHRFGMGRVVWGPTARQVLEGDGVPPDFTVHAAMPGARLDYLHRSDPRAEIYFVANQRDRPETFDATFRVAGRAPELWDPLTGETRPLDAFRQAEGCTTIPLELAPFGSFFVLFRGSIAAGAGGTAARNFPTYQRALSLEGPWQVRFDPKWGGPASVAFPSLASWTTRPEPGIRFYSGTATYRKTFDLPASLKGKEAGRRLALNLGDVRNLAEVRLNGRSLGVLWTPPFRVEITGAVRAEGNALEIDVVNPWYNRLVGDAALPPERRLTRTNIRLAPDAQPEPAGLLGPVVLEWRE